MREILTTYDTWDDPPSRGYGPSDPFKGVINPFEFTTIQKIY